MFEIKRIVVDQFDPDATQPRKNFEDGALAELGRNMLARGQLVPLIAYWCMLLKRFVLLDGERRWRAAQLVDMKELDAIVLPQKPSSAELRLLQLSIDVHRVELSSMERSDALAAIRREKEVGVSALADLVNLKQPVVTKLLKYQDGCAELKDLLRVNGIDGEKAYQICREPDFEKQRALLQTANTESRERLRQRAKGEDKPVVKASSVRLPLPGNFVIVLKGPEFSIETLLEVLMEASKQVRHALRHGHDASSLQRYLRETVNPTHNTK